MRIDNGTEYMDKWFMEFYKSEGITRHFTTPGTPQQNGVAERMNRIIMERARCMKLNAGLPKKFWAEATNMAVYAINQSPGTAIDLQILEEKWTSKKVDYSNLRTFDCLGSIHVKKQECSKLNPKSKSCLFMGFKE